MVRLVYKPSYGEAPDFSVGDMFLLLINHSKFMTVMMSDTDAEQPIIKGMSSLPLSIAL